jgi:hypothetical protein
VTETTQLMTQNFLASLHFPALDQVSQAANGVIDSYDALVDLLESIEQHPCVDQNISTKIDKNIPPFDSPNVQQTVSTCLIPPGPVLQLPVQLRLRSAYAINSRPRRYLDSPAILMPPVHARPDLREPRPSDRLQLRSH